jgi:hypothetical protein
MFHHDVIANGIEFIDVIAGLVGRLQALIKFEIENLESANGSKPLNQPGRRPGGRGKKWGKGSQRVPALETQNAEACLGRSFVHLVFGSGAPPLSAVYDGYGELL